VPTAVRRLGALLFATTLVASFAGTAAASLPPFDLTTLVQAEQHLAAMVNAERTTRGLVGLQIDPDVMAIARQRAETMAATDVLSHTNPDGSDVFDAITGKGIPWFGAGEVIVWNSWANETDSTAQAVSAWFNSAPHAAILLSGDFNYVGFGAAVSPTTGYRYYAGVVLKRTDRTGAWAKAGTISKSVYSSTRAKVTVRWTGGDPRLQVLTAGLRDYEVQRRVRGGSWRALGYKTTTSVTELLPRSRTYEYRIRARDKVGNRGSWVTLTVSV
jgi:uncharacterized protein YkwD